MKRLLWALFLLNSSSISFTQGDIESEKVTSDSIIANHFIGDGSQLTGINKDPQNLSVSFLGDTLFISEGNWVIIPGLSASNSGNAFANAGSDVLNACVTTINLSASSLSQGTTGQWLIIAGTGGSIVNPTSTNATFYGLEGEAYLLQWNVSNPNGSGSFDQLNISIADNIMTSVADAGNDSLAIMTQTIQLFANSPQMDSDGRWTILSGSGGLIEDSTDPLSNFTGVAGESYTLRWQHYNVCSTSSDEIILTFSESASGVPSTTGKYYIPDVRFRQYLQIAYSSIMDGDSLIVALATNISTVNLSNLGVVSLDGLQFFTELRVLNLSNNNDIVSIPYFSQKLKQFICNPCYNLEVIPEFPQSLDTIRLDRIFSIEVLPVLPDTMKYVSIRTVGTQCFPCNLSHSFRIPELTETYLIDDIFLDQFPLLPQDPQYLEVLIIGGCQLTSMPSLVDFNALDELQLYDNSLLKLDSLPENITFLYLSNNPIICVENKPASIASQLDLYPLCE